MKICALRLFNVKRFAERGVAIEGIEDGVNVLCAANEFGKSTSFEALHALFFQPHSGTPGELRKLRPYSGGSPLVEADIATDDGQFKISKQFFAGRFARVIDRATGRTIAQADEAENFIAGLVQGGPAGPAGLLWVRQGLTGIENRSRKEEDSEKQVRASLLESVQGEVEAVTGGRRMAEIMARVDDQLSTMVTPGGKPKAGGLYAAAIENRDRLDADRGKLEADVARLRAELDRRTAARKRLAELNDAEEKQARKKEIETSQAAFDAAKAQGEILRTAEAEFNLSRELRDAAAGRLGSFASARDKAEATRDQLAQARLCCDEAMTRRQDASVAIETARAEQAAAEREEQDGRALLARLDAALKAREKAERLAGLQERLREAEDVRRNVEQAETRLAVTKIPPKAIEELHALDIEIATLRAIEQTSRPSVAVNYESASGDRIVMDGAPLAQGEERSYGAVAKLVAPGLGTIVLRSNLPKRESKGAAEAEARQRVRLAAMGVADLAEAHARQAAAQELEAGLRAAHARLALLAPDGLPHLRAEVAAGAEATAEPLEIKADGDQRRAAHAAAENRLRAARDTVRQVEPLQSAADRAYVDAQTALAGLTAEQAQLDAVLGQESGRSDNERALSGDLNDKQIQLDAAQRRLDSARAATIDMASAEAALKRARSADQGAELEASRLREEIAGLDATIGARCDAAVEEKWREAEEAYAAAADRARAFEKEARALQRLSSALAQARTEARELYLKPVMQELSPLLALLFEDATISFDEQTLLPSHLQRNGVKEDVVGLSGGMKEQLSVLTRLAFARLLARDGRPTPVILDDALVYSDDDRIEKMFDALHRQSRDQQIIVFSCRQRAFQKLGGNVLEMTDWRPMQ